MASTTKSAPGGMKARVQGALAWLERHAKKKIKDEMGPRYGIHAKKAFGVSVANMHVLAKELGRDHDLAEALWKTGWYEARMLASFVDEPDRVTPAQMERWCKDFDNWGICDTVCFHLFDRSPHAFGKVAQWCKRRAEFEKRAGFALLACLALHDKKTEDGPFARGLSMIEKGATDDRNFVKKSVNWALRAVGLRSPALRVAAVALSERLAASDNQAARWVGRGALRELVRKP